MQGKLLLFGAVVACGISSCETRMRPSDWQRRLRHAAESWFAGTVVLVRDGRVVIEQSHGFADRERGRPNSSSTIYSIGSTAIDFTKALALRLVDVGRLDLGASIAEYLPDVPPDKEPITLRHLLESSSGLTDFHDRPGDVNPDHGWLERDAAVERILAIPLRHAPGAGNSSSHSAWCLLAAIIERADRRSFESSMRDRVLRPLGLNATGFYGDRFEGQDLAIGYGDRTFGVQNRPDRWRPTWLLLGSGGMVSSVIDLQRWLEGLRAGRLLSERSLRAYWSEPDRVLSGGCMYGFEMAYTEGPDHYFIALSNSVQRTNRQSWNELIAGLGAAVRSARRSAVAGR